MANKLGRFLSLARRDKPDFANMTDEQKKERITFLWQKLRFRVKGQIFLSRASKVAAINET